MNNIRASQFLISLLMGLLLLFGAVPSGAGVLVQCPGDTNGDAAWDEPGETQPLDTKCMHLGAGDGFVTMGDGTRRYIFSFTDLTGLPTETQQQRDALMQASMLAATFPAPTIVLDEGDDFYLTLTNVGMMIRPDLFDPHTVHYHGFPQAAAVFDGVPDASISINMGASVTYYYKNNEPGTYMYHCHVEATEHMQMGMLGNLYVRPAQDGTEFMYNGRTYTTFAYNDGDGSTGYDLDFPIQMGSFDGAFHDASENVQPLPFALMEDNYPVLNGRGYPDTADARTDGVTGTGMGLDPFPATPGSGAGPDNPSHTEGQTNYRLITSQPVSSLIEADAGQRILLRISNLNVTRFYTLATLGISMTVVGKDAKLLRGPDGKILYYMTNSVTLGGGEAIDAILEVPTDAVSGTTYFLYTTNLNYLNNDSEKFGGMMTEIRIN